MKSLFDGVELFVVILVHKKLVFGILRVQIKGRWISSGMMGAEVEGGTASYLYFLALSPDDLLEDVALILFHSF